MLASTRHIRQISFLGNRALVNAFTNRLSSTDSTRNSFVYRENFATRHNGINADQQSLMLKTIDAVSIEELVGKTIPNNIRMNREMNLSAPLTEEEFLKYAKEIASENKLFRSYIGMGYSNCHTPPVIQRNVFENPGW